MNRLSHSSISTFQECAKKYYYRYKEKIYGTTIGSSLVFGKAIDVAIEWALKNDMNDLNKYKDMFLENWNTFDLNGTKYNTKDSTIIIYSNRDLDVDLIPSEGIKELREYIKPINKDNLEVRVFINTIQKQKDIIGYDMLPKERKIAYNMACWWTCRTRGLLMLETFKTQIVPQIEGVVSVQEEIKITNGSGDEIVGLIDAVLKWKGVEEPVVFDFKTSARPYEDDAVLTSAQLSVYVNAVTAKYKTRKAGYIVFNKAINKNKVKICSKCGYDGTGGTHRTCPDKNDEGDRCGGEWSIEINPQCSVQVLVNELPESIENLVMENMDVINACINNNIFSRNLGNCVNKYNTVCPYYEVCHKGSYDKVYKKPVQDEGRPTI